MLPQNFIKQCCQWLLFVSCLFFVTTQGVAQDSVPLVDAQNWYQIDIIVFTQATDADYQSETWPMTTPLPKVSTAWELAYPSNVDQTDGINPDGVKQAIAAYDILPDDQFGLTDVLAKLYKRQHYRTIWHGAWVQPITKTRRPAVIYLTGGEHYSLVSSEQTGVGYAAPSEFTGLLNFKQTQSYIAVTTNLRLTKLTAQLPTPIQALLVSSADEPYQQFALQQTQRIRPNQVHYFDHPLFGMLIKITPYTPSAATLLATQTKLHNKSIKHMAMSS